MRIAPVFHFSARARVTVLAAAALAATMLCPPVATGAAPAAGDVYVYRVVNGYNHEVHGKIEYRVEQVAADRIVMSVTTDMPAPGPARTEVYTSDGNWLRHPLINHDQPVDYEFAQPYPAYVFPLEPGKSWSVRVTALNPANGQRNSVRVDGEVLGTERIVTPAGSFDTIKVRRRVYAGDWEAFRFETNIVETDWYAPALGRPAKSESNSGYLNPSRCARGPCLPIRGDWNLFELVETRTLK